MSKKEIENRVAYLKTRLKNATHPKVIARLRQAVNKYKEGV